MSAPGYFVIRPCPGVANIGELTDESKLLSIGNAETVKATVSQLYEDTQWVQEDYPLESGWVGTVSRDDVVLEIGFTSEKIYVGHVDIKWISIEVLANRDLSQEIKNIADALDSKVIDMATMQFL